MPHAKALNHVVFHSVDDSQGSGSGALSKQGIWGGQGFVGAEGRVQYQHPEGTLSEQLRRPGQHLGLGPPPHLGQSTAVSSGLSVLSLLGKRTTNFVA